MLQGVLNQVRLTWQLFRDGRVPAHMKAIPILAILYVLSPLDILPDVIPGIGQLDDIGILLLAMRLFESSAPKKIVDEYKRKIKNEKFELPTILSGR